LPHRSFPRPPATIFKVTIPADPAAEPDLGRSFAAPPAGAEWATVSLADQLNGDIRTLFQQKYLSPRPNTASLRLATDGFSTWQEVLGSGPKVPIIDLSHLSALLGGGTRLQTPSGAPFAWAAGASNIALTSMWDNWPRELTVPVGRRAEGAWLLVCGFTNPMQGRIANAELRFHYDDGAVEKVELVPPFNFWSL